MRESQIELASDTFRRWAVEHKSRGNGWKRLAIPVAPGGEQAPIVFLFGMAELSLATLHNEIPLVWIKRFGRDQTGPFEVHAIVDSKALNLKWLADRNRNPYSWNCSTVRLAVGLRYSSRRFTSIRWPKRHLEMSFSNWLSPIASVSYRDT